MKPDVPNTDRRDKSPQECKRQDNAKVAEKVLLLELVAGIENDGR